MTTTFKSAQAFPTDTTLTTVYTVPSTTTTKIIGATGVAKKKTQVTISITDTSATATRTVYNEHLDVNEEADLSSLIGMVLETTDILKVQTSVASAFELDLGLDQES